MDEDRADAPISLGLHSDNAVVTNVRVYRAIAVEAAAIAERALLPRHGPIPLSGASFESYVEPGQESFKSAMIAVVFAGMYIEATLWLVGVATIGEERYSVIDRDLLEDRLIPIGILNEDLRAALARFRRIRRDLVHEKAIAVSRDKRPVHIAQTEAVWAKSVIEMLDDVLARANAP